MKNKGLSYYFLKNRKRLSAYLLICVIVLVFSLIMYIMSLSGIAEPLSDSFNAYTGLEHFSKPASSYPLSVHFIDVGCGDSILISAQGRNILIDTGEYSLRGDTACYLKKAGVKHLDLFVASHTDSDHIGDFSSVADNIGIDKLWLSKYAKKPVSKQSEDEKLFYSKIDELGIKAEEPETGVYDFGGFTIEVMSPGRDLSDENENSLVLRLCYEDVSFLFMGDAGKKAEKELAASGKELSSDILKAGHHGSDGSSTAEFLKAVKPSFTVISAGEENKYLPSRKCIDRISSCGSEILRTDLDGTIIIVSDGKELSYITEK